MKRGIEAIAVFMIALVITIPFYVSSVYAVNIQSVTIIGSDRVENIVRPEDIILITADVDNDGTEVTEDMMRYSVEGSDPVAFSSVCSPASCIEEGETGIYECNCQIDIGVDDNLPITVHLFDENNNELDTKTKTVYTDVIAPTIEVTGSTVVNQELGINYASADTAQEGTNLCSGLTRVDVYHSPPDVAGFARGGGVEFDDKPCSKTGTVSIPFSGDGNHSYYLQAWDFFGHESETAYFETLTDYTNPLIHDTFSIFDGDREITIIRTEGPGSYISDATIKFRIEEDDLARVVADLSGLNINPAYSEGYRQMEAVVGAGAGDRCEVVVNGVYECVYNNIFIDVSNGNLKIHVKAWDSFDRTAEKDVTRHLDLDNTKPRALFLGTDHCVDDVCYAKSLGNLLKVTIEESGSGFSEFDFGNDITGYRVILDLSSFGSNYSNPVVMQLESNEGNTWNFEGIAEKEITGSVQSGDILRIAIRDGSADDMGNPVIGKTSTNLVYDNTPPDILGVEASHSCPTSAVDDYVITARVKEKDSGMLRIFANTSETNNEISSIDEHEGECTLIEEEGIEDEYECVFEIGAIVSFAVDTTLKIKVEDNAGNIGQHDFPIEICEAETTTLNPNFWESEVLNADGRISIKAFNLIDVPQVIAIKLTPIDESIRNLEILKLSHGRCRSSPEQLDMSINLVTADIINPLLEVELEKYAFTDENDHLLLNCTLDIMSRKGIYVYTHPEKEYLLYNITLFGQRDPSIDEYIQDKIDRIDARIADLNGKIGSWDAANDFMSNLCGFGEILISIDSVLASLKSIVYVVAVALSWAAGIGQLIWTVVCNVHHGYHFFVDTFMWPLGIPWSPLGWIAKAACLIYTCAICNGDFWNQLASIAGSAAANQIGGDWKLNDPTMGFQTNDQGEPMWSAGEDAIAEQNANQEAGNGVDVIGDGNHIDINALSIEDVLRLPGASEMGAEGYSPQEIREWYAENPIPSVSTPATPSTDTEPIYTSGGWSAWFANSVDRALTPSNARVGIGGDAADRVAARQDRWDEFAGDHLALSTTTVDTVDTANWVWDPYISIHYAQACLCLPGWVYNWKKVKQLQCMQRSCYIKALGEGGNTAVCDSMYEQRYCLYVTSASWLKSHTFGSFMKKLGKSLLKASPGIVEGILYNRICGAMTCDTLATGWKNAACGIWGASLGIRQLMNIRGSVFDFTEYNRELDEPNYCES